MRLARIHVEKFRCSIGPSSSTLVRSHWWGSPASEAYDDEKPPREGPGSPPAPLEGWAPRRPSESTDPATPSAPSSTGCSSSTSSGTSSSTRSATSRGTGRCGGWYPRGRRPNSPAPARGRLRPNPLPLVPGRAPAGLQLPDETVLPELPGEALRALRGEAGYRDPRARPPSSHRPDDPPGAAGAIPEGAEVCWACSPERLGTRSSKASARSSTGGTSRRAWSSRSRSSAPTRPTSAPTCTPSPRTGRSRPRKSS